MADELAKLLNEALKFIPNAQNGLPQEAFYFVSQLTPLINVDLLVKNKQGQSLLSWRDDQFYGPGWHIPGGIIRFKEPIEDRIRKVAETELGCRVRFAPAPINVRSLVSTERDIRGHFVSLLYLCELDSEPDPARHCDSMMPQSGQWSWHHGAPFNLIKQHEFFRPFIDDAPPL